METDEEIKELEEKLKNTEYKPFSLRVRLGILLLIILLIWGGSYLTRWLL